MVKAIQIKDFPNYYVTENGDVYSRNYNHTGRIKKLKLIKYQTGYVCVNLGKNNKTYQTLVHRLIAEAFIPNPENKNEVNHKNGIKDDNRAENLEWATRSENEKHAYAILGRTPPWLNKKGKDKKCTKIVLQIKDGKVVAKFYGTYEAERQTGICRVSIIQCCNGYKHYKTAGGYQWKYKDTK